MVFMKTNFKKDKIIPSSNPSSEITESKKDLTQEEFEDYMSKAGAVGSFMVFRSNTKKDELGIDSL